MPTFLQVTAAVLLLFISTYVALFYCRSSRSGRLPPGPKGLPIIGNVHQLPKEHQEKTFYYWGQQFGELSSAIGLLAPFSSPSLQGDFVYAKFFRTPVLVVNSVQVARDLMEKRSGNYSDRPSLVLIGELYASTLCYIFSALLKASRMGMDAVLPFMPYGARFKKVRKWFHSALQPQATLKYRPYQRREARIVLDSLMKRPDEYQRHFAR